MTSLKNLISIKSLTAPFLLFTFIFFSCQSEKNKTNNKIICVKRFPIVIDTFSHDRFSYFENKKDSLRFYVSNYPFCYIGEVTDTIYIQPNIDFSPEPIPLQFLSKNKNENKKRIPESPFKKYYMEYDKNCSFKNWEKAKLYIRMNSAFKKSGSLLVMITNIDTDTITIGYGTHIPLIVEAIDSFGYWRPIQDRYKYGCGGGIGIFNLPPNECVLTLAPIFTGNYKTKLRLTIGDNHSKSFIGYINYSRIHDRY